MRFNEKFAPPEDVDVPQARRLQNEWCRLVSSTDDFSEIQTVAGLDVGFENNNTIARGAVAVLSYPGLNLIDQAIARRSVTFPYIPGFLSFREVPVLMDALDRLEAVPDLLLCDGQGIAHPRRFGIACHISLITGIPSVGVGKSRLCGSFHEPGPQKGDWSPLKDKGEAIGAVLRTRDNTLPLFISTGHRVSLQSAIEWTLSCCTRYKLPETTRHAHRLASG